MSDFQFYINGTLLTDEPIGWNESKIKFKRSDKYDSLFVQYVNDLYFHGDGYAILTGLIDTVGVCAVVDLYIKYRCNFNANYDDFFIGRINLNDVELDDEKCTIKCNIEDSSYADLFLNRIENVVPLTSEYTITGFAPISLATKVIGINSTYTANTYIPRNAYTVYDTLEFFVKFLTDNKMSFASDFFGTTTSGRVAQVITFAASELVPASAKNIFITIENIHGIQSTKTIPLSTVNAALSLASVITNMLKVSTFTNGDGSYKAFTTKDFTTYEDAATNGTTNVTLYSDLPIKIISVTGINCSITNATPDLPAKGKKSLCIAHGYFLRNATVPDGANLSFSDLYTDLSRLFNLAFSIGIESNQLTLRVEPLDYFLEDDYNVYLTNVMNLKRSSEDRFSNVNISVGEEIAGIASLGLIQPLMHRKGVVTTGIDCYDSELDLQLKKCITDAATIIEYAVFGVNHSSIADDQAYYLIECTTSTHGYHFDSTVYSGATFDNANMQTTYYSINNQMNSYWSIINNFNRINGNPKYYTREYENTKEQDLSWNSEFDYKLSYNQYRTIVASPNKRIRFNKGSDVQNDKEGFLDDCEYDLLKGMCKFKLLSN